MMYLIMVGNSAALSLATYGSAPFVLGVGVPAALCLLSIIRALLWLRRRDNVPTVLTIRRHLVTTYFVSMLLAVGFVGWGLALFENANLVQRTCIGLFVFIAVISCAFCLQSFPAVARVILFVGALPLPIRMFMAGDWFLVGTGMNMVFVTLLIDRIVRANHARFTEALESRYEMLLERERARGAERQAHDLAYRDPLTSLPNRRALTERLDDIVAGEGTAAALMIVDLDRFKDVNDVHGHLVGDELLRLVSSKLVMVVGSSAEAFRLGGDEFAVIAKLPPGAEEPSRLAKRLVEALRRPLVGTDVIHHVGGSVGIACYPQDAQDCETLMRKADIALYEAKTGGRGVFRMFKPAMEEQIRYRSSVETELRRDVRSGALTAFVQPIVDLSSGQTAIYELLARWVRDGKFFVGPDQFIPIAEDCGLINELMLTLLEQGCEYARSEGSPKSIAVNISPIQLKDPRQAERILSVLESCRYPPQIFGIEVTENALVSDFGRARDTLETLKRHGVQIALDDFGTGYSSLRHLHLLPFDKIKIDRSFVTALPNDDEALKIIRAIVNLASGLRLGVVAEGVESEEIASCLRQIGCTHGQGFHYGAPMPVQQLVSSPRRSAA